MKLHLGCGKRFIDGYVHVDAMWHPHVDIVHQIDRIPAIPSDSVEVIYACHVLEHFHRQDTVRVLEEWRRILKPKGILRVAVPDFEELCKLYLEHQKLRYVLGPLYGRQDYIYNIHYTAFDFQTLKDAIIDAGFRPDSVSRYDWRKTDHANVDDYSQSYFPHMDKENGRLLSLNVEAQK